MLNPLIADLLHKPMSRGVYAAILNQHLKVARGILTATALSGLRKRGFDVRSRDYN